MVSLHIAHGIVGAVVRSLAATSDQREDARSRHERSQAAAADASHREGLREARRIRCTRHASQHACWIAPARTCQRRWLWAPRSSRFTGPNCLRMPVTASACISSTATVTIGRCHVLALRCQTALLSSRSSPRWTTADGMRATLRSWMAASAVVDVSKTAVTVSVMRHSFPRLRSSLNLQRPIRRKVRLPVHQNVPLFSAFEGARPQRRQLSCRKVGAVVRGSRWFARCGSTLEQYARMLPQLV